jgi:DNA-binding NtrC family response regulator
MNEQVFALLVHDRAEPFGSLRRSLGELSVTTYSISTCKRAREIIRQCQPQVVFTESALADGTWISILEMAESSDVPPSVVVVGSHPDTRHYLSAMERGAYDFVVPPFEREPLKFVVRSAALNACTRRDSLSMAAAVQ